MKYVVRSLLFCVDFSGFQANAIFAAAIPQTFAYSLRHSSNHLTVSLYPASASRNTELRKNNQSAKSRSRKRSPRGQIAVIRSENRMMRLSKKQRNRNGSRK